MDEKETIAHLLGLAADVDRDLRSTELGERRRGAVVLPVDADLRASGPRGGRNGRRDVDGRERGGRGGGEEEERRLGSEHFY